MTRKEKKALNAVKRANFALELLEFLKEETERVGLAHAGLATDKLAMERIRQEPPQSRQMYREAYAELAARLDRKLQGTAKARATEGS